MRRRCAEITVLNLLAWLRREWIAGTDLFRCHGNGFTIVALDAYFVREDAREFSASAAVLTADGDELRFRPFRGRYILMGAGRCALPSGTPSGQVSFPPMVPATSLRLRKRVRNCMVLLDSVSERMEALAA